LRRARSILTRANRRTGRPGAASGRAHVTAPSPTRFDAATAAACACGRPSLRIIFCTRSAWRPPSNGRGEEVAHDLVDDGGVHDAGAEADDVGVVVGAGHAGFEGVVALGGADAVDLVGGDAHADAGAAHQHAALGAASATAWATSLA
jgi:hypothetical protein